MIEAERRPANSAPLVTIGLPVYNGETTIKRALCSLLDQDYPNIEIVISDNASTDNTVKVCRRILKNRTNVRIIEQPINQGPHANFEAVVKEARGEFFMWGADDDYWRHSFVSRLVAELVENPDACVAMSGVDRRYEDNSRFDIVRFNDDLDPNGLPPSRLGPLTLTSKFNLFIYGLYRTDILRKGIAYFPRALGGDRMLVTHFALGHPFRYVDELLYMRTHRADHAEAYDAAAAKQGARLGQVMAFAALIARTRALPLVRKLGLPGYVTLYARFVFRDEVGALQDQLRKLIKPWLKPRNRDSLGLTLLGVAGAAVLGAGISGWTPRGWIGAGVFALALSFLLLMLRTSLELQSARKKLRILADVVERDHDMLGMDSHRVRKLLGQTEQIRAALIALEARLDSEPPDPSAFRLEDGVTRLPIDRPVAMSVSDPGAGGFRHDRDEDDPKGERPMAAAPPSRVARG